MKRRQRKPQLSHQRYIYKRALRHNEITMSARPRVKLTASFYAPRPQPVTPTLYRRGAQPVLAPFATKANPSAVPTRESESASHGSHPLPPTRWVSDVRARIGKCIGFGCDAAQIQRAAGILGILAREWRVLSAGSEGFLTGGRRGLESQQVVWGEMDSFGHVNNTVYIRYAESARVNWILHYAAQDPKHREAWTELMQPKTIGLIMKSIKADFKFPMTAPDTISVYHRLRTCPEATHTSLVLDCVILSHRHRRVAARTFEDVAIYDYRDAKKTVLPGFMLDVLRDTWRQQEERTDWARGRIWDLLRDVERLEKETWDRKDAVEDLGAAAK
ncbi:thioesterase-like superfamily-domain-containing protein [Xylaria acuta]|nr:thioesterase-like superfamily-domain-containing protein [Xylaria acuta]